MGSKVLEKFFCFLPFDIFSIYAEKMMRKWRITENFRIDIFEENHEFMIFKNMSTIILSRSIN